MIKSLIGTIVIVVIYYWFTNTGRNDIKNFGYHIKAQMQNVEQSIEKKIECQIHMFEEKFENNSNNMENEIYIGNYDETTGFNYIHIL